MKYLYVPEALIATLEAAGISIDQGSSLETLTDVNRMLDILSPEDVAFYWYVNHPSHLPLPAAIGESLTPALQSEVLNIAVNSETSDRMRACVGRYLTLMGGNDTVETAVQEDRKLIASLVDNSLVTFTHVQGDVENEADTYDRVIETIHPVLPFEQLAKLPMFNQWLRSKQSALV